MLNKKKSPFNSIKLGANVEHQWDFTLSLKFVVLRLIALALVISFHLPKVGAHTMDDRHSTIVQQLGACVIKYWEVWWGSEEGNQTCKCHRGCRVCMFLMFPTLTLFKYLKCGPFLTSPLGESSCS